jgi:aminoglycoside 6'-N-acetyltransferase
MSGSQWPARYEIRVGEVLDGHWSVRFEGLEVRGEADETVISGPLQDESALHRVLAKVRDLAFTSSPCTVWDPRRREEETWLTVILRGERVLLRPGLAENVARLARIRREPEVAGWWGDFGVEEIKDEFMGADCGFVIEVDGDVIGAIQYSEENEPMYRHAGIDIFVTSSRRGQGLGPEAISVLRYLFEERGHHRLTIDPGGGQRRRDPGLRAGGFPKGRSDASMRTRTRRLRGVTVS